MANSSRSQVQSSQFTSGKATLPRKCRAEGCRRTAIDDWGGMALDGYCLNCYEEIHGLEAMQGRAENERQVRELRAMFGLEDRREQNRQLKEMRELRRALKKHDWSERIAGIVEFCLTVGDAVRKWIWVPELVLVGSAVVFLSWTFGAMFLRWLLGQ